MDGEQKVSWLFAISYRQLAVDRVRVESNFVFDQSNGIGIHKINF